MAAAARVAGREPGGYPHAARVLGNAAAEWLEVGWDAGFLLRGSRLEQFEAWVAGTDLALTGDEQAFMEASLEERRERGGC